MKNKISTEILIQQYFTSEETQQLNQEIKEEVKKMSWGKKRKNAGQKAKIGVRKNKLPLRELMRD